MKTLLTLSKRKFYHNLLDAVLEGKVFKDLLNTFLDTYLLDPVWDGIGVPKLIGHCLRRQAFKDLLEGSYTKAYLDAVSKDPEL